MKFIAWLSARRKALVPFFSAGLIPAGFYLHVSPASQMTSGAMWYSFILALGVALGVYAVGNDGTPQAPVAK